MSSKRRLPDEVVRSIFEHLHHNKPLSPDIPFRVVHGCKGQNKMPPPFEYPDGLYVITAKPPKKKKNSLLVDTQPKLPAHLADKILDLQSLPPNECKWNLSGPQFPPPTSIQQRYCYPRGRPEYCSDKGGSMYTMFSADGVENFEYRLLDIYFSEKRATNRGVQVQDVNLCPPRKKAKTAVYQEGHLNDVFRPVTAAQVNAGLSMPKSTTFSFDSQSLDDSTLRSCPIFACYPSHENVGTGLTISLDGTQDDPNVSKLHPVDFSRRCLPPPPPSPRAAANQTTGDRAPSASYTHYDRIKTPPSNHSSAKHAVSPDIQSEMDYAKPDEEFSEDTSLVGEWDPFPLQPDATLFDFDSIFDKAMASTSETSAQEDVVESFDLALKDVHNAIKEKITKASKSEQGLLLSVLSKWAKQMVKSPLGLGEVHEEPSKLLVTKTEAV